MNDQQRAEIVEAAMTGGFRCRGCARDLPANKVIRLGDGTYVCLDGRECSVARRRDPLATELKKKFDV